MKRKKSASEHVTGKDNLGAITIRVDPKTRYMLELACRYENRYTSNLIETILFKTLQDYKLKFKEKVYDECGNKIEDYIIEDLGIITKDLWDVDEADRIVKLAFHLPSLLTYEEQKIWKLITRTKEFWDCCEKTKLDTFGYPIIDYCKIQDIDLFLLNKAWDIVKKMTYNKISTKEFSEKLNEMKDEAPF